MDCSTPSSSVHGISQARILEWVAISFSRGHIKQLQGVRNDDYDFQLPKGTVQLSSVTQLCPTLRPHELQQARLPCPSPTPGVPSDSHPTSQWCYPAISSSVIPFSSCPQSLPASGSFPMSQFFSWGGQSTGVSALASFLPKKSQGWSPSEWTVWISL